MKPIIAVAALLLAGSASAQNHVIEFRVHDGARFYGGNVKVDGTKPFKAIKMFGEEDDGHKIVFNGAGGSQGQRFRFEYQFLFQAAGKPVMRIQAGLDTNVGETITAVDCGPYTLEIAVDAKLKGSKPAAAPVPWKTARVENSRVTLKVSKSGHTTFLCRAVSEFNSQLNVVLPAGEDRPRALTLNIIPSDGENAVNAQYQLEYGPPASLFKLSANIEGVVLGKSAVLRATAEPIELTIDGVNPSAKAVKK
jgi:hypothetical protein